MLQVYNIYGYRIVPMNKLMDKVLGEHKQLDMTEKQYVGEYVQNNMFKPQELAWFLFFTSQTIGYYVNTQTL